MKKTCRKCGIENDKHRAWCYLCAGMDFKDLVQFETPHPLSIKRDAKKHRLIK